MITNNALELEGGTLTDLTDDDLRVVVGGGWGQGPWGGGQRQGPPGGQGGGQNSNGIGRG